jgi:Sec-independent protein translocase protein TatA
MRLAVLSRSRANCDRISKALYNLFHLAGSIGRMRSICPQCGSSQSRRRSGAERVCRECGTRFTPTKPVWERSIFAFAFLVPGLLFAIVVVFLTLGALGALGGPPSPEALRVAVIFGVLALPCLVQGVRELIGRGKKTSQEDAGDSTDEAREDEDLQESTYPPPLVPQEEAEALVRDLAEKYKAKRILRSLGNLPPKQVANAAAHFASQMEEDETPLVLLDSSFLRNGKAGLLITNRALYSSFYAHPIWLADIDEVSYATPGLADHLAFHFFGGIIYAVFFGFRNLQNRLRVNGKTVYSSGNPLRWEFWIELLTELAAEARRRQRTEEEQPQKPSVVILEIARRVRVDDPAEMRQIRNPSWHDLERSIRALNQDSHPSLLIWSGEVEQAPALEILGGNGKYVLRELGDGWTYYDPSAGEEEIEVCKDPSGHRVPAFYVCTDLQRVLTIARHFVETGTPE